MDANLGMPAFLFAASLCLRAVVGGGLFVFVCWAALGLTTRGGALVPVAKGFLGCHGIRPGAVVPHSTTLEAVSQERGRHILDAELASTLVQMCAAIYSHLCYIQYRALRCGHQITSNSLDKSIRLPNHQVE